MKNQSNFRLWCAVLLMVASLLAVSMARGQVLPGPGFLIKPTVAASDPNYSSVTLLLKESGGTIVDTKASSLTLHSTSLSSTQTRFGNNTFSYNGTSNYIRVANGTGLDLGSGNFTIEGWFYLTSASGQGMLAKGWNPSTATNGAYLIYHNTGNSKIEFYCSTNGTSWDLASGLNIGTRTLNAWVYIMITRSGNVFTTYLGGVQGGTVTAAGAVQTNTAPLTIMASMDAAQFVAGFNYDVRITKGVARANVVPTVPHPIQ